MHTEVWEPVLWRRGWSLLRIWSVCLVEVCSWPAHTCLSIISSHDSCTCTIMFLPNGELSELPSTVCLNNEKQKLMPTKQPPLGSICASQGTIVQNHWLNFQVRYRKHQRNSFLLAQGRDKARVGISPMRPCWVMTGHRMGALGVWNERENFKDISWLVWKSHEDKLPVLGDSPQEPISAQCWCS